MMLMNPIPASLLCDFYKLSHRVQLPNNTEEIYATWTPRATRIKGINEVVLFGPQSFIKNFLIDYFNVNFFGKPVDIVVAEYVRVVKHTLGEADPDASHLVALHKLGYLPLKIKALPEGTVVPIRVPMLSIQNTHPDFDWLTNYVETIASCEIWQSMTSATIALQYRKILNKAALETVGSIEGVEFQGHDFSMRGMGGLFSAINSGMGHLTSFVGTDTIPAILGLEHAYNADISKELVGCSIPATEHSVMCANGQDEKQVLDRIVSEVYPNGFVSVVGDTWNLWEFISNAVAPLKDKIMAREGKVVIRPDSGDPVDIVCGTKVFEVFDSTEEAIENLKEEVHEEAGEASGKDLIGPEIYEKFFNVDGTFYRVAFKPEYNRYDKTFYYVDDVECKGFEKYEPTPEDKGVIELLWEIFGGTTTEKGYRLLDSHIGCIYGDAITLDRCKRICDRLADKEFASLNMVYGIGSYTYQYNTRDTFGFAMKSTACVIDGKEKAIFKDPITDNGTKKSQKGRVIVQLDDNGVLGFTDELSLRKEYPGDLLEDVFVDGKLLRNENLCDIRARILEQAMK